MSDDLPSLSFAGPFSKLPARCEEARFLGDACLLLSSSSGFIFLSSRLLLATADVVYASETRQTSLAYLWNVSDIFGSLDSIGRLTDGIIAVGSLVETDQLTSKFALSPKPHRKDRTKKAFRPM